MTGTGNRTGNAEDPTGAPPGAGGHGEGRVGCVFYEGTGPLLAYRLRYWGGARAVAKISVQFRQRHSTRPYRHQSSTRYGRGMPCWSCPRTMTFVIRLGFRTRRVRSWSGPPDSHAIPFDSCHCVCDCRASGVPCPCPQSGPALPTRRLASCRAALSAKRLLHVEPHVRFQLKGPWLRQK